jgi:hypothetical protein
MPALGGVKHGINKKESTSGNRDSKAITVSITTNATLLELSLIVNRATMVSSCTKIMPTFGHGRFHKTPFSMPLASYAILQI